MEGEQANPDVVDPNSYREILRFDGPSSITMGHDRLRSGWTPLRGVRRRRQRE